MIALNDFVGSTSTRFVLFGVRVLDAHLNWLLMVILLGLFRLVIAREEHDTVRVVKIKQGSCSRGCGSLTRKVLIHTFRTR